MDEIHLTRDMIIHTDGYRCEIRGAWVPGSASYEDVRRQAFEEGVRAALMTPRLHPLPANEQGVAKVLAEYDTGLPPEEFLTTEERAKLHAHLDDMAMHPSRRLGETDDEFRDRLRIGLSFDASVLSPAEQDFIRSQIPGARADKALEFPTWVDSPSYRAALGVFEDTERKSDDKVDAMVYGRRNWGESVLVRVAREMRALAHFTPTDGYDDKTEAKIADHMSVVVDADTGRAQGYFDSYGRWVDDPERDEEEPSTRHELGALHGDVDYTKPRSKEELSRGAFHQLRERPTQPIIRLFFKCLTHGCPDREPVEALEPPTCYTCGKLMKDLP